MNEDLTCGCVTYHFKTCRDFPLCSGTEGVEDYRVLRLEAEVEKLKDQVKSMLGAFE